MAIEMVVQAYIRKIRPLAKLELDRFKEQPTLTMAVEYASMAINSEGKRYSHQRRLKRTSLEQARDVLVKNTGALAKCKSFAELFSLIEDMVISINGIGELYVYDTSLRIGARLDLLPMRVYLHTGTREGAKAMGFDSRAKAIRVSEFPSALQQLEAHEIEDVLCIFKDRLSEPGVYKMSKGMRERSWCC